MIFFNEDCFSRSPLIFIYKQHVTGIYMKMITTSTRQQELELHVEKEVEIDGVGDQMSIDL